MKHFRNIGVAVLTFAFTASFAQETTTATATTGSSDTSKAHTSVLTYGIKLGANATKINGIDSTAKGNTAPAGGGFVHYQFAEHWGIGADVHYAPIGIKYNKTVMIDSTSSDNFDYDLKFVYLQMPVYVSYSFLGADSKLQPKVYAGLSFSARIKANLNTKFERTVGDSIAASRETDDETVAYKYSPVDVGALGGLAVDYWLTDKMFLGLDFRYTTSLFDLSENETNRKENAIKTNQIGAFLTFGFRCGKK